MSSVRRNQTPAITPKKRCAVYTRKSTDEGLDQEYNSLEAQRDAGLAFIASQRHEGWIAVDDGYDDGGYSGGNMERPGLRRLMIDIEAGKIDTVVVYKIDRLTRSLPDFAKLVEVFDRNGVSFVSVTQQFNTTSSMGRLTLNILLSFAQFEREVTGVGRWAAQKASASASVTSRIVHPRAPTESSTRRPSRARRLAFRSAPRRPMLGVRRFCESTLTCESGV